MQCSIINISNNTYQIYNRFNLVFNITCYLIQIIYVIYNLNKNIVNFLIFIMNNDINVHTMYFMTIHIILNIISIRIIIYYLI